MELILFLFKRAHIFLALWACVIFLLIGAGIVKAQEVTSLLSQAREESLNYARAAAREFVLEQDSYPADNESCCYKRDSFLSSQETGSLFSGPYANEQKASHYFNLSAVHYSDGIYRDNAFIFAPNPIHNFADFDDASTAHPHRQIEYFSSQPPADTWRSYPVDHPSGRTVYLSLRKDSFLERKGGEIVEGPLYDRLKSQMRAQVAEKGEEWETDLAGIVDDIGSAGDAHRETSLANALGRMTLQSASIPEEVEEAKMTQLLNALGRESDAEGAALPGVNDGDVFRRASALIARRKEEYEAVLEQADRQIQELETRLLAVVSSWEGVRSYGSGIALVQDTGVAGLSARRKGEDIKTTRLQGGSKSATQLVLRRQDEKWAGAQFYSLVPDSAPAKETAYKAYMKSGHLDKDRKAPAGATGIVEETLSDEVQGGGVRFLYRYATDTRVGGVADALWKNEAVNYRQLKRYLDTHFLPLRKKGEAFRGTLRALSAISLIPDTYPSEGGSLGFAFVGAPGNPEAVGGRFEGTILSSLRSRGGVGYDLSSGEISWGAGFSLSW